MTTTLLAFVAALACEKTELGQPCGTEPSAISEPIGGEVPVLEIVRLQRDGECESFMCLTHQGLSPYCTRSCKLDKAANKQKTCTGDEDCSGGEFQSGRTGHCVAGKCQCEEDDECRSPLHCADGRCRDDDCPEGYWCKTVQDVGPLAGQRFCIFRTGCAKNSDCEAYGVMECRHLGCFDACLRSYQVCDAKKGKCTDLECYDDCVRVAPDRFHCPETLIDSDASASCRDAACYEACTLLNTDCDFHRLVCEPLTSALRCECVGLTGEQSADLQDCPDANLVCQPDSTSQPWTQGSVKKLNACLPEDS